MKADSNYEVINKRKGYGLGRFGESIEVYDVYDLLDKKTGEIKQKEVLVKLWN